MTWEELIKRCLNSGWGRQVEDAPILIFSHLWDLGWLQLFRWVYSGNASCYFTHVVRDRWGEGRSERLFIRLEPKMVEGSRSLLGRAVLEKTYSDNGNWPALDCFRQFTHICATSDPAVMECWLRRLPIDWSILG